MTARQIITARFGRDLGPLATMPTDLRKALYRLALELQRNKWRMTDAMFLDGSTMRRSNETANVIKIQGGW